MLSNNGDAGNSVKYNCKAGDSLKRFYKVKEFAEELGVHYNTVYKGIRDGKIIALRLTQGKNANYRIPVTEIHRIAHVDLKDVYNSMNEDEE